MKMFFVDETVQFIACKALRKQCVDQEMLYHK